MWPGGIACGAHLANRKLAGIGVKFVHGWAIDYDQSTVDTYRANIKGATVESVIRKDVRDPDLIKTLRQISDIDVFCLWISL